MDLSTAVLGAMRKREVPMSELTFCILIKGFGRTGDVPRVRRTYDAMLKQNLVPDLATYNALLDAFG